jgi:hypothetical protein
VLPREHELDEPTKRFISALIWHVGDLSLLNDEAARRELIYKVLASLLVASRQMSEHQLTHLELATGLAHHPALRLGVAVQQPTDESTQALVVMGTDQVSWLVSYTRQREGLVVKAREAEAFDA